MLTAPVAVSIGVSKGAESREYPLQYYKHFISLDPQQPDRKEHLHQPKTE